METTLCREIVIDSYVVGTISIMDYADKHPNEYFDHTDVRSSKTNYGRLMVSDYKPSAAELECDRLGITEWHDLYNGWQRTSNGYGWVCRKNGRYISITD